MGSVTLLIDASTLGLMFGLMILVEVAIHAGLVQQIAVRAQGQARRPMLQLELARPRAKLKAMSLRTPLCSARQRVAL